MLETTDAPPGTPEQATAPTTPPNTYQVQWRNPERSIADYAAAVWSCKFRVLLFTMACGVVALVYGLRKPNSYASYATVMVHGTGPADTAASLMGSGTILPGQVATAVDIIQSRVVLEKVVDVVGHDEILRPYQPLNIKSADERSPIDVAHVWLTGYLAPAALDASLLSPSILRAISIEQLKRSLVATPAARGTTVGLRYLHTSPSGAEKILDAIVQESVRRYGEVVAPPAAKDWLEGKVKSAKDEEAAARAALAAFAEQHKTTDFTQEITSLADSLILLEGNVRLAKMQVREHNEVLKKLRAEIEGVEPRIREVVQEVYSLDPVRQNALRQLVDLKVLRAAEDTLAGGPTPMSLRLDRQISSLEKELNSLRPADPAKTVALRDNPEHTALDAGIRKREIDLLSLRAQIPVFEESLVAARQTLEERRTLQRDVMRLHESKNEATLSYKRVRDMSKSYEINNELDLRGLTQLRTVEPASRPQTKEGPSRGKLLLGGLFGSMLMAMTWILIRTRTSRRLIGGRDVAYALGRSDVICMPRLQRRSVRRFEEARRRGWE